MANDTKTGTTPATGPNTGATTTTATQPQPPVNPPAAATTTTDAASAGTTPPAEGGASGSDVSSGGYTVASKFHDRNDFSKVYKEGDAFTSTDKNRIADLERKGLIKKA